MSDGLGRYMFISRKVRFLVILSAVLLITVFPNAYASADSSDGTGGGVGEPTPDDPDRDGDKYPASEDCDDGDPKINPGATEISNGVDDDCDGRYTKGDILIIRGVPGLGLSHAKGTVKFFNNSKGFGF